MHDRTVDGHVRFTTEQIQYRTVPEKVKCRTGQMLDRTNVEQDYAGQDACRTRRM